MMAEGGLPDPLPLSVQKTEQEKEKEKKDKPITRIPWSYGACLLLFF